MPPAPMSCATCRKAIAAGARWWRCTVASCNTGRLKLRFCSHRCWEAHVPTARHRNAGFVEEGGAEGGPERPGEAAGGGEGGGG